MGKYFVAIQNQRLTGLITCSVSRKKKRGNEKEMPGAFGGCGKISAASKYISTCHRLESSQVAKLGPEKER